MTNMAFQANTKKPQPPQIPARTTAHTPAPPNYRTARQYPDSQLWAVAHDNELSKIDNMRAIQWIPRNETPPKIRPLPLTMTYKYKRDATGHIEERKARCAVRGDLMKPHIHYDPDTTATFAEDKTTIRLILAHAAAHRLPLEHFDISSAFLHEDFEHTNPVFIRQHPSFNGSYRHDAQVGQLRGNLYCNRQAGRILSDGARNFLASLGYTQLKSDLCTYTKITADTQAIIATTINDFLICATHTDLISDLYNKLKAKYTIKRLGYPTKYLNWKICRNKYGIHISQPHVIDSIISKTRMTDSKPLEHLYSDSIDLSPPKEDDEIDSNTATTYRETLG